MQKARSRFSGGYCFTHVNTGTVQVPPGKPPAGKRVKVVGVQSRGLQSPGGPLPSEASAQGAEEKTEGLDAQGGADAEVEEAAESAGEGHLE